MIMVRLTFILCLFSFSVNAQSTFDWALNAGGTSALTSESDDARTTKCDAAGNVYMGGTFYNTTDFDPGPGTQMVTSAGSGDGYIAKYDANGNFLALYTFTNNLDCRLISLDIDNNGNIIATGHFQGSVDFDPGAGTYNLSSPSGYDFFVLKLNANGTLAWAIDIGASSDDLGLSVATDPSNNVLVTGYFQGTTDFDPGAGVTTLTATTGGDAYVLKLSPGGTFQWAFNIGNSANSNDRGLCIDADAAGNVFVGGNFQGTCDFDPSASTNTMSASGSQSAFLCKYSSSGALVFAKKFDGTGRASTNSFYIASSNDVFAACTFSGNIDADPGAGVSSVSTGTNTTSDFFIAKLDASGSFLWVNQVGGAQDDGVDCITGDASGIYFSGFFFGNVDFDSGSGSYTVTPYGFRDFFVSKIDLNGAHLNTYTGGDVTSNDRAYALASPTVNTIYLAGSFYGSIDADPSAYATATLTSNGGTDAFLIKLKTCTQTPTVVASNQTICQGSGASVSLTASGSNTLQWNTTATTSVIVVTPTITTVYSVTANFATGCVGTTTIDVQVLNCNGLSELSTQQNAFALYPNPATHTFKLRTELLGVYTITNMVGKELLSFQLITGQEEISVQHLPAGVYYVRTQSNCQKLIITH